MSTNLIREYQIMVDLCEEFMTTPDGSFSYLIWAADVTHYNEMPAITAFSRRELDSWAEGKSLPSVADRIYTAIVLQRFFENQIVKLRRKET